jgi:small conductance mechanosensitive channel
MAVQDLVIDLAVRYGFQVLGALVILGLGVLVARWVGRLADRRLERQRLEPPLRVLIVRVVRMVVMLFALVVALDKFGFEIAPLVAGIGVAGLGVGIALQGVLGNVVAGLSIIFTKPFRVGEHISVAGASGDVAAIELFSTTLVHPDRSRVVIPNRRIVGEILHNFGTTRQLHLTLAVPLDADLASVLATTREVVDANPRVLKDPAPLVGIAQVGEAGIAIAVRPWVTVPDFVIAEAELYRSLIEAFRARGVDVPMPRREIRVINGPVRAASA